MLSPPSFGPGVLSYRVLSKGSAIKNGSPLAFANHLSGTAAAATDKSVGIGGVLSSGDS